MHDVVIVGGGPTGLMLAGELGLAGVDVVVLERRATPDLAGSRAGGFHARTIEMLDQRGIADRFLAEGRPCRRVSFGGTMLDLSDLPTRHPYTLALFQNHIERILLGWVEELGVPIRRGRRGDRLRAGRRRASTSSSPAAGRCARGTWSARDGGRSVVRAAAGIEFAGADATRSNLIAEVRGDRGAAAPAAARRERRPRHAPAWRTARVRVVVTERELGPATEPTLDDLSEALTRCSAPTSACTTPRGSRGSPTPPGRRPPTARAGCCWPATPRTSTPPRAARASAWACRTRSTSAGSSRRWSTASRPRSLLDTYQAERHPADRPRR